MFEESVASIPSLWASMNSWFTPTIFFVLLNIMIGTIYVTSSLAAASSTTASPKHNNDVHEHRQQPRLHPQLVRSPSMLQRLKSINFYTHRSQEPTSQLAPDLNSHFATHFQEPEHEQQQQQQQQEPRLFTRSPSMLQRLKSINLYNYMSQETDTVSASQETETQPETEEIEGDAGADGEVEEAEKELEPSLEQIYSQLQEKGHVSRTTSDTKPASGEMPPKLPRKMRKSASVKSPFMHFEEEEIVEVRRPSTVREGKVSALTEADEEVDAKADDFINKFKQQLKLQRMDSIIRYKEMIGRGSTDK